MRQKLILLIVFSITLLSCGSYSDIGTIKQSVLRPDSFKITQKGVWVLLDGREVSQDSKLFKLLKDNSELNILKIENGKYYLPNSLGRFIRSNNYNGKGDDPETNRVVGSYQVDEFKSHAHNYKSAARKSVSGDGSKSDFAWDAANYTTDPVGGAETRPKNISMYTYIKISK